MNESSREQLLYCQSCGAAYLPDTEACDFCPNAELILGRPPLPEDLGPMADFLKLRDSHQAWEAENVLTGDGIPTELWERESLARVYALPLMSAIVLRVPANCAARARATLRAYGYDMADDSPEQIPTGLRVLDVSMDEDAPPRAG